MSCKDAPPAVLAAKRGWENSALEGTEASASAGASSRGGGQGIVSGSSDLGSERHLLDSFQSFQFHSKISNISGPEASNRFSGRKRSNRDSPFMDINRDKMLPTASDSPDSSCLMKMLGKEVVSERRRRPHDDEVVFTMQPPSRPPSSSLILHPPISGGVDSVVSKWERSMPMNAGTMVCYPSRFGQSNTCINKHSSSCTYGDSNSGVPPISLAAADEGSRTVAMAYLLLVGK